MYKQKEIVLVPFPYSDLSANKKRPVLIISNDNYNSNFPDIVVCVITSNLFKDNYSIALNSDDLEIGIMPEQSIIKCHKIFTIDQSLILKRFSIINDFKFEEVSNKLSQVIKPTPKRNLDN
jgi:mRNA interferase MazF